MRTEDIGGGGLRPHLLFLDFETRSTVDIAKCGSFKYIADPSFDVLLLAYAWGDEPVKLVDFAQGETWPEDFLQGLRDPDVTCIAHNCAFERAVIGKLLEYTPPEHWFDTMHLTAHCGLPLGLDGACKALGLPEDQAKMKEGKALIRYFCTPPKATKTNGGRPWNLPEHAPEKWDTFRRYCKQDVESMRTIFNLLKRWLPDETERRIWALDAKVNEKGMNTDQQFVRHAMEMDGKYKAELTEKAIAVSGIENPNSVQQVKDWLKDQEDIEVPSLNKKEVADVIANLKTDRAKQLMEIRSELSKTSTKKYDAFIRCAGEDDHVRGCFQFFGAHSGRWCLTGDHEVLTPDGWIRLDEWSGGRIAVWNASSRIISFQESEALSFPYEGEMIQIDSVRCQQVSTPDHKMLVRRRNGSWEPKTMKELYGHRFSIPFTGQRNRERVLSDHNALRILIMVQADGHYTNDGDLKLKFKRLRKVERCKRLLRLGGIPYQYVVRPDGSHAFVVKRRDMPLYLRAFRDKTFGWWMLDEDPSVIIQEIELWDGTRCGPNSIQYTTCVKQNADILQAVCQLAGLSSTLLVKKRGEAHPNWSDAYVLNIWLTPGDHSDIRSDQQSISQLSGTVYCASTPTGYFLVRRNGVVWVTGNSGRLVQLQNLKQNHLPDLDDARELVKTGDFECFEMLYPNVTGTLSELIRTSLIAEPGEQFVVSDFSAIEARVSAWFAHEEWVLDVFRNGGDIYCDTDSQMFKVPVVKNGENGHLRQKGKVAILACIAEGELVLTDTGLVPIENVTTAMKVWDGENWVTHEGLIYKGEREVITYDGLTATPDHLVWVEGEQRPIQLGVAASCGARLVQTGDGRNPIRLGRGYQPGETVEQDLEPLLCPDEVRGMRVRSMAEPDEPAARFVEGMPEMLTAEGATEVVRQETNCRKTEMREPERRQLRPVRGEGNQIRFSECESCRDVPDRKLWNPRQGTGDGPHRYEWELRPGKYPIRNDEGERSEQAMHRSDRMGPTVLALCVHNSDPKTVLRDDEGRDHPGRRDCGVREAKELERDQGKVRVYDLRNAGPNHRFTVSGRLVHNCGYGGGVNALKAFGADKMGMTNEEMAHTVDLWRKANPRICAMWKSLETAMKKCIVHKATTVDKIGGVRFRWEKGIVWMRLPSGREMAYYGAEYGESRFKNGMTLSYLGINSKKNFTRIETWGGRIFENLVQATARDCLRDTMLRLDADGWDIRGHIHDEVICSEPINGRGVEEMCEVFARPIDWAPGLPLTGAGYTTPYYRKD